jgi:hypothetical protein
LALAPAVKRDADLLSAEIGEEDRAMFEEARKIVQKVKPSPQWLIRLIKLKISQKVKPSGYYKLIKPKIDPK